MMGREYFTKDELDSIITTLKRNRKVNMDIQDIIQHLRNPYGKTEASVKEAMAAAADMLEAQVKAETEHEAPK